MKYVFTNFVGEVNYKMHIAGKKTLIAATLATLVAIGCLAVSNHPAQARLDELLSSDNPYPALQADEQAEQQNSRVSAVPCTYVVQKGDTLSEIALQYDLDVNLLAEINNLRNNDHIIEGQVIMLPGTAIPYRVKRGETLSAIALRFGCSEARLAEVNELRDPDYVLAGQQILIPAGQGGGDRQVAGGLPLNQFKWPVVGWISSPYGMRGNAMHEGLDIAADMGQPVRVVKDGRVVFAGPRGSYGNTVIVDHGNGLRTLYAHNSRLLVSEGEQVSAGQHIALVGSTGRSTGPHLHFEVLINGTPIDPALCLERSYA
jgi:murein DD-endopeptidase MepM/ murein hydrolase activator NlpD